MIIQKNMQAWLEKDTYDEFKEPTVMCINMNNNNDSTNKDRAIRHGISRPKIINTFHNNTKVQDDGCIVWTKSVNENGYGVIGIAYKDKSGKVYKNPVYAHRFAWALKHGMAALPIGGQLKGDRMVLNHLCHNTKCVNTNHLEVILQSQNNSIEKRKPKNGTA